MGWKDRHEVSLGALLGSSEGAMLGHDYTNGLLVIKDLNEALIANV
jgi:hypothetical protein